MDDKLGNLTAGDRAASWKKFMYSDTLPEDYSDFRRLLETYSKIPPEDVEAHIYRIRDRAWEVAKYPCIGRFSFARLSSSRDPAMLDAVARLRDPASSDALLDVGCCLAQTVRHLVMSGVDPSRLYATDLRGDFWDIGYELFRDRDRLPETTFVAGDILDPADENLARLDGKVTLVHAAHFFHLFSWDDQVRAAERIVRFLDLQSGNCVVFGRMIGSSEPGTRTVRGEKYLHDGTSFQRLWDEVGERTGPRWKVDMDVLGPVPGFQGVVIFAEGQAVRFVVKQMSA